MIKVIAACAIVVAPLFVMDESAAFAPSRQHQPVSFAHRHQQLSVRTALWRLEATNDDDDTSPSNDAMGKEEASLFYQINDFLDTPILDANNRSDQGALAETLKRFVRREPQVASITFSAVVVAFMFLLVRVYNFISYGI